MGSFTWSLWLNFKNFCTTHFIIVSHPYITFWSTSRCVCTFYTSIKCMFYVISYLKNNKKIYKKYLTWQRVIGHRYGPQLQCVSQDPCPYDNNQFPGWYSYVDDHWSVSWSPHTLKSKNTHTYLVLNFNNNFIMPSAYGARLTTFEDSEKESECGYVRKVSICFFVTCPFDYISRCLVLWYAR